MKKINGFTLIELLAVIVILAIILIIGVPRIINVVEESNKEAFRITGENLIVKAEETNAIDNMTNPQGKTYTIIDGSFVGESLSLSGKLPDSGNIIVNEDGIAAIAVKNDKYCAIKGFSDERVSITIDIANCEILEPTPEICFQTNDLSLTEVEIIGYDDLCIKDVVIPKKINGKTVTSIGESALSTKELTSVTIPNSVINIGYFAFGENLLTKVVFQSSSSVTTIGEFAFYDNQISNIIIPKSVISMEYGAFESAQLTSVIFESPSNIENMGTNAFAYNQLTSIIIPKSLTNIGDNAFIENQLTSLTFESPSSLTSIPYGSFSYNQLTSVTIPNGVTSIGDFAFKDNQLANIIIPSSVEDIGDFSFGLNQLTSVTISNGVISIGPRAFLSNLLTSVTIPNSVTSIGNNAFIYNEITSVTIPNSVTSIGGGAFNHNQLPNNQAFIYKRNNDGSQDPTTIVSYGGLIKTNLSIPNGIINIEENAFAGNQIISIIIPSSVKVIKDDAFSSNLLTSIIMPANVTIEEYSVYDTFYTTYVTNNARAAGTYTAPSQYGTWTKQS